MRELWPARMIVCSSRSRPGPCPEPAETASCGFWASPLRRWPKGRAGDFETSERRCRERSDRAPRSRRPSPRAWRRGAASACALRAGASSCPEIRQDGSKASVSSAMSSRPMNATSMSFRTDRLGLVKRQPRRRSVQTRWARTFARDRCASSRTTAPASGSNIQWMRASLLAAVNPSAFTTRRPNSSSDMPRRPRPAPPARIAPRSRLTNRKSLK